MSVEQTSSAPAPSPVAEPAPSGIGGWLILLGIGLVLGPFRLFAQAAEGSRVLSLIPSGDSLRTLILIEVVVNAILGVALFASAMLFFRRKRAAPAVIGLVLAASVLFVIAETLVIAFYFPGIPAIDPPTVAAIIIPLLWIAYLRTSERVKNTFVT
jgi:hypothetical protein